MRRILMGDLREPKGHYTPAVEAGGLIFASGILPIVASTGKPVEGDLNEQLKVLFDNVSALLTATGCQRTDVVRTGAFISSITLWDAFNKAYKDYFGDHKPARTVIPIGSKLHYGLDVEMDFVAESRKPR